MSEFLDVVDLKDEIVGTDTRKNIHQLGLLHRHVWVWLFNDNKEILLQMRSKDTDSQAERWDSSVGGHVEKNESYEDAAMEELKEELGLKININDLTYLDKIFTDFHDINGVINNVFTKIFALKFSKNTQNIRKEKKKCNRLEWWPIKKIINMREEDKHYFTNEFISDKSLEVLKKMCH